MLLLLNNHAGDNGVLALDTGVVAAAAGVMDGVGVGAGGVAFTGVTGFSGVTPFSGDLHDRLFSFESLHRFLPLPLGFDFFFGLPS